MINLLIGKKGSGKTKRLVECANKAIGKSEGNVVVIEKGIKLTFDLDHNARLINIDNYGISDFYGLYGFVCGICAGNYDVTDIFIDSTLKIGGHDINKLTSFIERIDTVCQDSKTNLTLSVSADGNELPVEIKNIVNIM